MKWEFRAADAPAAGPLLPTDKDNTLSHSLRTQHVYRSKLYRAVVTTNLMTQKQDWSGWRTVTCSFNLTLTHMEAILDLKFQFCLVLLTRQPSKLQLEIRFLSSNRKYHKFSSVCKLMLRWIYIFYLFLLLLLTISVYFRHHFFVIKVQNSPVVLCTGSPGLNFSCRCQSISTHKTIPL